MKKIAAACFILACVTLNSKAQTTANLRKPGIGFSFIANDYATPELIRTTSYASVKRKDQWAKLKDMGHGFAAHYFNGFTKHVDFAATLGGSFVQFALPGKTSSSDHFLAEIDASANFKMFEESAFFNPYIIAGIGASKYTNVFGAFIPLGGGVSFNLFNEAKLFSTLQYRIPVTTDANKHHLQISFGISGNL